MRTDPIAKEVDQFSSFLRLIGDYHAASGVVNFDTLVELLVCLPQRPPCSCSPNCSADPLLRCRSEGLCDLIGRLLSFDPALRPSTAEVLKVLQEIGPGKWVCVGG